MLRFVAIVTLSTSILQAASLLAAPATPGAGAQAPAATGAITGTAQSASGQMLPNYTVQLRNLKTVQLTGTTTSNASGSFSFVGVTPASYVIEVVNQAGAIVGSSAPIPVASGATVAAVSVTAGAATAAATGAAAAGLADGGINTALLVTTVAVAAGIAAVVVVARDDASPAR